MIIPEIGQWIICKGENEPCEVTDVNFVKTEITIECASEHEGEEGELVPKKILINEIEKII